MGVEQGNHRSDVVKQSAGFAAVLKRLAEVGILFDFSAV
jgi:hypothetical protein